jgi:selenide,water dikinase
MTKSGARPGDQLFLTKPLGTGIITTAAKLTGEATRTATRWARRVQGKPQLDVRHLDEAILSMTTLNRSASRAAQVAGVRGATDITGFGLLGHGCEMASASGRSSGAGLRIRAADVPALPGAWTYIDAGYLTRGSKRNPEAFGENVRFASNVTPAQRTLLWEVETSGGLLLAVPADRVEPFHQVCAELGQGRWAIGEVVAGEGVEVV